LPKIRQWDAFLRTDPSAHRVVREVHPEVSFAAMRGGRGLDLGKKTKGGQGIRTTLLGGYFGAASVQRVVASNRGITCVDDSLDALAGLWTAERIIAGKAQTLPSPPERDSAGLSMAIWF
jgi:predicted RNase H-like nuclease